MLLGRSGRMPLHAALEPVGERPDASIDSRVDSSKDVRRLGHRVEYASPARWLGIEISQEEHAGRREPSPDRGALALLHDEHQVGRPNGVGLHEPGPVPGEVDGPLARDLYRDRRGAPVGADEARRVHLDAIPNAGTQLPAESPFGIGAPADVAVAHEQDARGEARFVDRPARSAPPEGMEHAIDAVADRLRSIPQATRRRAAGALLVRNRAVSLAVPAG